MTASQAGHSRQTETAAWIASTTFRELLCIVWSTSAYSVPTSSEAGQLDYGYIPKMDSIICVVELQAYSELLRRSSGLHLLNPTGRRHEYTPYKGAGP